MRTITPFQLAKGWGVFAVLSVASIATSIVAAQVEPRRIASSAPLTTEPEVFVGSVYVEHSNWHSLASGVVVGEGTIATAAHILFDANELSWATNLRFGPSHHQRYSGSRFRQNAHLLSTIQIETPYQERRIRDIEAGLEPGASSYDTFNLDIAAASRFTRASDKDWVAGGRYPVTRVDPDQPESLLREPFQKMILGYPSAEGAVPEHDRGFMHRIDADNYEFYWNVLSDDAREHRDSGGFWMALYWTDGFISHGGSSGGPVFVWDPDLEQWVFSAVVVGGGWMTSLVRAIDGSAWNLIDEAVRASGAQQLRRIEAFSAEELKTGNGVLLEWADTSPAAAGFSILRQSGSKWKELVHVPATDRAYLDLTIEPGEQYAYAIQPVDARGNSAPRSAVAEVSTRGVNAGLASAVGAPYLAWSTGGSVGFIPAESGVRSSRVPSLGKSYIATSVTGPGTLTFEWSVSSEENEEYDLPGSDVQGVIYDAFYFSINGVVEEWISGLVGRHARQFTLPEGHYDLRWEYQKDPYADHYDDAGLLHSVTWEEASGTIIYGGVDVGKGYSWAHWWGYYTLPLGGWSYHLEFGWLYQVSADGLWSYSLIPGFGWFYTAPDMYPFIYTADRGWLYYFRDSGLGGESVYVYDYNLNLTRRLGE